MFIRPVGPAKNVSESDVRVAQVVPTSQQLPAFLLPPVKPKRDRISLNLDEHGDLHWAEKEPLAVHLRKRASHLPSCTGYVRAFVSTIYEAMIMLVNLDCKCWTCRKCGPWNKVKWLSAFLPSVMKEEYLEKQEVDAEDWGAKRRALNRGRWKYLRFTMVHGNYVLLTNQKGGGIPIMKRARQMVLYRIIDTVAFISRPISASRNWGIKLTSRRSNGNWIPLDTARYNFDECIEVLKANDITPTVRKREVPGDTFHRATFTVMELEDLFPILWKLGVLVRGKGEIRIRGRPVLTAA